MFGQEWPDQDRMNEFHPHSDLVNSIQWANTGIRFVSGSSDGTAIIWRYEEQKWRLIRLPMSCRLEGAATADEEEDLQVEMVRWSCDDSCVITGVSLLVIVFLKCGIPLLVSFNSR